MSEEEQIALFDAYFRNEIAPKESVEFEMLLEKKPDFKAAFDSYITQVDQIKSAEEYRIIKHTLSEIHKEKHETTSVFRMKLIIPILATAAIILIIFTVYPLFENGETSQAANMVDDYAELNAQEEYNSEDASSDMEETSEMDSISSDFEPFENINSPLEQTLSYFKSTPKGTAFLLSEDGYFITAKHLVHKKRFVKLQNEIGELAFNAEVIFRDSLADFAILKCSGNNALQFGPCPYRLKSKQPSLGEDAFTLGYPKSDIVYTSGEVSSANGFKSDTLTYELTMPSNSGNSGAPLFTKKGDLIGFIIANNSKKQSVTYAVKPEYINQRLEQLKGRFEINTKGNRTKYYSRTVDRIEKIRPFVFEVHY